MTVSRLQQVFFDLSLLLFFLFFYFGLLLNRNFRLRKWIIFLGKLIQGVFPNKRIIGVIFGTQRVNKRILSIYSFRSKSERIISKSVVINNLMAFFLYIIKIRSSLIDFNFDFRSKSIEKRVLFCIENFFGDKSVFFFEILAWIFFRNVESFLNQEFLLRFNDIIILLLLWSL